MNKEGLSKYREDKQDVHLEHFLDGDDPVTYLHNRQPA